MNNTSQTSLLGPAQIRELCDGLGIKPTKTLGQNFVHDGGTVTKIVREAQVTPGTHVLEVGPGLGSLTLALLQAGALVSAIEIDPTLALALPVTVESLQGPQALDRLQVWRADALSLESWKDLDATRAGNNPHRDFQNPPTALVANLPYNVAVPVLLNCLEKLPSLETALVMVQAEVADRLAAPPGSRTYGVPSAKLAWYGSCRRSLTISRSVFWPVPNVDSALVAFQRESHDWGIDRDYVFAVIDTAFAQRRKTLRAALKNWMEDGDLVTRVLEGAGIAPTQRGESLSIGQFVAIAKEAKRHSLAAPVKPGSKSVKGRRPQEVVRAVAPGKVNLLLNSATTDETGKHQLFTIFQAVDLWESVSAQVAPKGCFQVETFDSAGKPLPHLDTEEHLALRAARALAKEFPQQSGGVTLRVEKSIPEAGGMAGGSADAAAALVACAKAWNLKVSPARMEEIARTLGADVPFALTGGIAVATGYGDRPTPVETTNTYHWVFAIFQQGLSTPQVFAHFDEMGLGRQQLPSQIDSQWGQALRDPDALALAALLENDLQAPAFSLRPELKEVTQLALQAGALAAIVSGSGPTVAALVSDAQAAQKVAQKLRSHRDLKEVVVTTGPVAGAHLVSKVGQ